MARGLFDLRLAWGKWAETVVAEALKREGWYVIRQHDIVTQRGGPRAEASDTAIILADLLRIKSGVSRMTEIKQKDSPAWWRAEGQLRHGVDLPYWRQYLQLQQESGIPGDLIILELSKREKYPLTPRFLIQSFNLLDDRILQEIPPGNHPEFPKGIVYWLVEAFDTLAELPADPPAELGDSIKARLHGWRERPGTATLTRVSSTKPCPVCGEPGYLGFANDPSVQYCHDHMPGLSPKLRALYREAVRPR